MAWLVVEGIAAAAASAAISISVDSLAKENGDKLYQNILGLAKNNGN